MGERIRLADFIAGIAVSATTTGYPSPGTLTVTCGNESVTLDAMQPHDVFERNRERIDELLLRLANPSPDSGRAGQ